MVSKNRFVYPNKINKKVQQKYFYLVTVNNVFLAKRIDAKIPQFSVICGRSPRVSHYPTQLHYIPFIRTETISSLLKPHYSP